MNLLLITVDLDVLYLDMTFIVHSSTLNGTGLCAITEKEIKYFAILLFLEPTHLAQSRHILEVLHNERAFYTVSFIGIASRKMWEKCQVEKLFQCVGVLYFINDTLHACLSH